MAFFQLMLKARNLEKSRLAYEDEKLRSIEISRGGKVHYTFFQKMRLKKIMCKRKMKNCCEKMASCPKDSWFHRKAVMLRTDGTFENFILKSVMGFLGGIFLTYMFFMFFVFQLNFALSSATMLCSLFGIILTIGLAFSYRIRCVVFLLLPQFFSKRGRQALMAYAFILALTGPAKNTLHNTGVLSESLACGQEQLKEAVRSIIDLIKEPFYALRDAIAKVIKTVKIVVKRIKEALLAIKRMVLSILRVIRAVFQWLGSIVNICNKKLGTPFERCQRAFDGAVSDCYAKLGPFFGAICNLAYVVSTLCYIVKPLDFICILVSFVADAIIGDVRKKIKKFTNHMAAMFYVKVKFSHSFHFETNKSRSIEEISTGIVTEIRSRTDRFLAVFDWMSFATSFFVLFMLLRVIHYRQKWLTNERFDNRYLTEDLRHIDMIRAKKDKETVLPLNPRERNKYISLTSITLITVEKIKLTKSAVFLCLTTFKLCIHMIADYSLYWVLSTIRYHGRFETKVQSNNAVGVYVSGNGYLAQLYRSIVRAFTPLGTEMEMDTVPCLPDPVPPDLDRYTQIISLIFFCWIMAIFEPYGLRLRHVVMTYYHPERAKQRAVWLYNHIIRSRSSFLKYARRQLRRKFGMTDGKTMEHVTLKERLFAICPILNIFFHQKEETCLLCSTVQRENQLPHIKCPTPGCIGLFCTECFADLQNLCTICLAPIDYGDLSDMSEEMDSSDDQQRSIGKKKTNFGVKPIKTPQNDAVDDYKRIVEQNNLKTDDKYRYEIMRKDTAVQAEDLESSSSDYSQTYQNQDNKDFDCTPRRIPYRDIEAQKLHDDVTIQIFNEPLRDETTSGSENPTSCFVVRAHRRLKSRFKRKDRCSSCGNSSSSSSTSTSDADSVPTDELEEDEVLHVQIEDDSKNRDTLGVGGGEILAKKSGRYKKIVNALNKVSWLKNKTVNESGRGIKRRRPSLMHKVMNMLQDTGLTRQVRTYNRVRDLKNDGKLVEDRDSSSSDSLSENEYEKRALISPENGSRTNRTRKQYKRKKSKKNRSSCCCDYSDDCIYETSWDSHRSQDGGKTPRSSRYSKNIDPDRYSRIVNSMSKDTQYYEINERNINKLSNARNSREAGRTEASWNIPGSEEKQKHEKIFRSLGMSTIDEDSKELSSTENRTKTEDTTFEGDTDEYVDVTGLSSTTNATPRGKYSKQRRESKYVTNDEWKATTPAERKRKKNMMENRRGVESRGGPELYDPLAGLEIYGVQDKRKNKPWVEGKRIEINEDKSIGSSECNEPDTKSQTTTTKMAKKRESMNETSETETQTSGERRRKITQISTRGETKQGRAENYEKHRRFVKRLRKNRRGKHCKKRRTKIKAKDDRRPSTSTSPNLVETSTQHSSDPEKSFGNQSQPEEWLYDEQRRVWEQMCAKMTEYSHRFGYPKRVCQPVPCVPYNYRIPRCNMNQIRPRFYNHQCPRFTSQTQDQSRVRSISPVLKKFLPRFQKPGLIAELKTQDRSKLVREREERKHRCECGKMSDNIFETSRIRGEATFNRNILSRPSTILESTEVLPYQETKNYRDVVDEYRRTPIRRNVQGFSQKNKVKNEEHHQDNRDQEPLVSVLNNVDDSKDLKQLFPTEYNRRPSSLGQVTNKIVNVLKKKHEDETAKQKIVEPESGYEMATLAMKLKRRNHHCCESTSPDETTTDNNETIE